MTKRNERKIIGSLQARIREHEEKIAREQSEPNPNSGLISHWMAEIVAWQTRLHRLEERVVRRDGEGGGSKMIAVVHEELRDTLKAVGIEAETNLLGMHLSEIEAEMSNIFELLTQLRVRARCQLVDEGQETLVDLSVALGHLGHHVQAAVPILEHELDIEA